MKKLNSFLIFGLFLGLITQAKSADREEWGTGDLWKDWEKASCCQKLQIGLRMLTGCEIFLPGRSDRTPEASPQGSPTAVTDPIFTRKEGELRPFAKSIQSVLELGDTSNPKLDMKQYMNNLVKRYRKNHDEAISRLKGK